MRNFLRALLIFRPLNLLMIGLFQLATFYFLNFQAQVEDFQDVNLWLMIAGLLLVTAGGYALNDKFDEAADSINKPDKLYVQHWSSGAFWIIYILLNICGIYLSYLVSAQVALWIAVISVLLFLYSAFLQKLPLIGNLTVALCTSYSILEVYIVFQNQNFALVMFFTLMAFLLTLSRELLKDLEDIDGDQQSKYRTLPILLGERNTVIFAQAIIFFTLVLYLMIQYQWIAGFFSGALLYVYYTYQILCVLLPMWYLFYKSGRANKTSEYRELSVFLKYVMLTGVGSMLLF